MNFEKENRFFNMAFIVSVVAFTYILILFPKDSIAYSSAESCPKQITHIDNLQFSRAYQEDLAECWISINDMNSYINLVYRSYLIASDGLLMVFNSYGTGPASTNTGARHYYFFPREVYFNEVSLHKDIVSVRLNKKLNLQFNTKSLSLINQAGFQVKTDLKVNRNNHGGVEVLNYDGVFLDLGFALGKSPAENPEGKSTFKNQFSQICEVRNRQIFDYKDNDSYLHGDRVLQSTVNKICPEFKWQ